MPERAPRNMPLAQRLDRRSEPRVPGQCQLWLGETGRKGYGRIKWRGRKLSVHRATWECERGPIPDGFHVLHTCDTPACRNVEHLFLGTNADNMADRNTKARQARGEASGRAKLTEAEVLEIRAIRGVPHWVIGAMYGVSEPLVGDIRRRKAWDHL